MLPGLDGILLRYLILIWARARELIKLEAMVRYLRIATFALPVSKTQGSELVLNITSFYRARIHIQNMVGVTGLMKLYDS